MTDKSSLNRFQIKAAPYLLIIIGLIIISYSVSIIIVNHYIHPLGVIVFGIGLIPIMATIFAVVHEKQRRPQMNNQQFELKQKYLNNIFDSGLILLAILSAIFYAIFFTLLLISSLRVACDLIGEGGLAIAYANLFAFIFFGCAFAFSTAGLKMSSNKKITKCIK